MKKVKEDKLFVNQVTDKTNVKNMSKTPIGNASEEPFCVYGHQRHAVGSKIVNEDGSEAICQPDSSWKNS